mmetsp:Transcript_32926/g.43393  ORF Transcript_32926/g.43393 Transcript_32926/m.43393 type:complete len:195 (+) Transcript_32926:138-722(+)
MKTGKLKIEVRLCFDVRVVAYTYLPMRDIFKTTRLLCKTEFKRILKAKSLFAAALKNNQGGSDDQFEVTIPSARKIESLVAEWTPWWSFFFQVVPKPTIKLTARSSALLAATLLERYSGRVCREKLAIEIELSHYQDCNQWTHLMLMLTRGSCDSNGRPYLFREIVLTAGENLNTLKFLDLSCSSEKHLILLSM